MSEKNCMFSGCINLARTIGLCHSHYCQQLAGKPLTPLKHKRPRGTPPVIAYDEVPCPRTDLEGPCHIFRGYKKSSNPARAYGLVIFNGNQVLVHRYVWELAHGPIPENLEIDHQCRTPSCCNIKHLRAVTHQVNSTENIVGAHWQLLKEKTHCVNGHEFTPDNTAIRSTDGAGYRRCRMCSRINKKRFRQKQKVLAACGNA